MLFVTCLKFSFMFQLEIIDACVSYIEKLQSQLLVKPTYNDDEDVVDEDEDEDVVDDDEGIDEGDVEHQQTSSKRLTSSELEDCNGNLEK